MRTMALIGILLVTAIWPLPVKAQSTLRSDKSWRGKNVHSGNKVRTSFYNYGMIGREIPEVGDYGCEWPINSGHVYVGDVSVLVGAEIKVRDKNDSVLTVHSVVVSDGPRSDNDGPAGNANVFWGWEPIADFSSVDSVVAMSHQSETWPSTWPDKTGDVTDPGWKGKWNGYFGKNVLNADQESFWKMDDNYDEEFETLYSFTPDRFNADRKGLALQMTVRGMQWSNPLAEDCIFWLYEVTNYGTQYYDKTVFGMIMGGIAGNTYDGGSDSNDDLADFYRDLNLTSSYDGDNRGAKGFSPVAYSGYAFLESPGNPYDGIDNDGDGFGVGGGTQLTRDHQLFAPRSALTPGTPIVLINYETYQRTVTAMGTSPVQVFYNGDTLTFYPDSIYKEIERNNLDDDLDGLIDETNGLALSDTTGEPPLYIGYLAKNYLTGDTANLMIDERRDDGIDNDGDWNAETDDTGLDGSFETVDEGQRDGIPTSGRNTDLPGEPHVDKTDVDESDQIGLTSFYYFDNGGSGKVRLKDDEGCWLAMRPGYFNIPNKNPIDGDFIYGTGYFPLNPGMTERLSLALLFGEDEQDLIRNKNTVQTIYDNNYNFAKAPDIPTVWSYAGDGFVTIYWDDVAERSNDIVTGYDFEGYKVYRTTDPSFLSNGIITDGYGTSKFSQPIMIYDKLDGWKGFFPYGIDGVQFLLSWDSNKETGLYHSYTDSSVVNGIRYFYAVTSYDHGEIERRIPPSECSKYATIDENGNIQTAKNVATVIPGPRPTGYRAAMVDTLLNGESLLPFTDVKGTGKVYLQILKPDSVANGRTYQLHFIDQAHDQIDNNFNWRSSIDLDSNGIIELNKDAIFDDVGQDGDPTTADYGFGDGKPTAGEPNVDENDPDEFYPYTSGYYVVDVTNSSRPDTVKFVPYVEASPFMKTATDTVTIIGSNGQTQKVLVQHQVNTIITDTVMVTLDDTLFIQSQADTIVNRLVDLDTRDIFNGVRLTSANDQTAVVIDPTTYEQATYSDGFPNNYYGINFKPFEFANFEKGIEYPRDYMVVFYDHIVDTSDVIMLQPTNPSKPKVPLPARPVKFKVFDADTREPVPFGFIDDQIFQNPSDITGNDKIIFYEKSPNGTQIPTWAVIFVPKDIVGQYLADTMAYVMNDYIGADGPDTLVVTTKKPFRSGDVFQFTLRSPSIGATSGDALDRVTVVPNPYIVYSNFETFDYNVSKHKLKFMGLPARCTIRIYNLNGYLVDTIEHQSTEDGTADWDLLTSEGLEISYGIYIYHVDAPGVGKKIGKFAVIK